MRIERPSSPLTLPARFRRGASALWRETDGGWYGPRGACGCCESCDIFSDDFNRADSSDLGADWDEVSGSWSITSNTLRTSSTNAVAVSSASTGTSTLYLKALVKGDTSSDCVRLVFAYENSSNYWFAELFLGAAKAVRIGQVVAGFPTILQSTSPITTSLNTFYRFSVCVSQTNIVHAVVYDSSGSGFIGQVQHASSTSLPVGLVGVGTGSPVNNVEFDDFELRVVSEDCEQCTGYCTACVDPIGMPPAWDITMPSLPSGGCNTAQCTAVGATWRAEFYFGGSSGFQRCQYRAPLDAVCPGATLVMNVSWSAGTIDVDLTGLSGFRFWRITGLGSPIDCADSYVLVYSGTSGAPPCGISGTPTVTITPVL